MNILEIIKKAPKDHKYWSLVFGECEVDIIKDDIFPIYAHSADLVHRLYLTEKGTNVPTMDECLLFPSKDNRDWEAFERELDGVKDNDSRFNPPAYGTDSYKNGVLSGYYQVVGMTEINLDHGYYKELPYIDFQIDGKKYRVSTDDMKRLAMDNADNKTEHILGQSFDGTAEMVSIPGRPMTETVICAAVICAGLLAGGCKDKGAALINKAVNYADMILDYTKEEKK